jgi:hypothetical protein
MRSGRAAVGRVGDATRSLAVGAPHRATMSLDGGTTFEVLPDEVASNAVIDPIHDGLVSVRAVPRVDAKQDEPHADKAPHHDAPSSDKAKTNEAVAPAAVLSESALRQRVTSCLKSADAERRAQEASSGSDSVIVTVSSNLNVKVDAEGTVKSVSFNPPLLPKYQSCAVFLFHEHMAPGERTVTVPVSLQ